MKPDLTSTQIGSKRLDEVSAKDQQHSRIGFALMNSDRNKRSETQEAVNQELDQFISIPSQVLEFSNMHLSEKNKPHKLMRPIKFEELRNNLPQVRVLASSSMPSKINSRKLDTGNNSQDEDLDYMDVTRLAFDF